MGDTVDEAKLKYVFFISCAIAPLSLLGSLLTLRAIHAEYSHKRSILGLTTYQRLLAGISVFDGIMSLALSFGPLPIPAEYRPYGLLGAHGNTQTCTTQGFFLQLGTGSFAYSSMLMLYFVLVIRYNLSASFLARRIEPWMHVVGAGFFTTTALIGLQWKIFNTSGLHCWVGAAPLGCEYEDPASCQRGGVKTPIFGEYLLVYPYIGFVSVTILCTIIIAWTVYWQYQTRFQHVFRMNASTQAYTQQPTQSHGSQRSGATTLTTASTTNVSSNRSNNSLRRSSINRTASSLQQSQSRGERKLQQAVVQSMLYGIWFFNFSVWALLSFLFDLAGTELDYLGKHFWMAAIQMTLFPSQGIFNFCIYLRPTYLSIRQSFPQAGRWFAIREAVWHPFCTANERTKHYASSLSKNAQASSDLSQQQQPQSPPATQWKDNGGAIQQEQEQQLHHFPEQSPDPPVFFVEERQERQQQSAAAAAQDEVDNDNNMKQQRDVSASFFEESNEDEDDQEDQGEYEGAEEGTKEPEGSSNNGDGDGGVEMMA